MEQNIVNPFSRECEYWVALAGKCFGTRHLPGSEVQLEADSIHRIRPENRNVSDWKRFLSLNEESEVLPELLGVIHAEEGVTDVSIANASALLLMHGEPERLEFKADKKACDWTITAKWPNGAAWTFNGFAWGYGGTGPAGLEWFLDTISASDDMSVKDIPLDKFGKTDCDWENPEYYHHERQ